MSDQPYQYDPSGTYQFNNPNYYNAAVTSAQAAGWNVSNPEEQQQDTGQPVSDLSRSDQINQISQILGNSPEELATMSDDEICQLPMTQDQFSQLSQILFGGQADDYNYENMPGDDTLQQN